MRRFDSVFAFRRDILMFFTDHIGVFRLLCLLAQLVVNHKRRVDLHHGACRQKAEPRAVVWVGEKKQRRDHIAHCRPELHREKTAHAQAERLFAARRALKHAHHDDEHCRKGEDVAQPRRFHIHKRQKSRQQQYHHSHRQQYVEYIFLFHFFDISVFIRSQYTSLRFRASSDIPL